MAYFSALRETLSSYILPKKPPNNEFVPTGRKRLVNGSLKDPDAEVERQLRNSISATQSIEIVKSKKITRAKGAQGTFRRDHDKIDFTDGETTLIGEESLQISEDEDTVINLDSDIDDEHTDDDEEPVRKKAKLDIEHPDIRSESKLEKREREESVLAFPISDHYSSQETFLIQKLRDRGYEPLLPHNWQIDFLTYPKSLFVKDSQDAFIRSLNGKEFRAIKSLTILGELGVQIRGRYVERRDPSNLIRRTLKNFFKWAFDDADLSTKLFIPLHTIYFASPGEGARQSIENITSRLHDLRKQWRDKYEIHESIEPADDTMSDTEEFDKGPQFAHSLPTLYGLVITHSIVMIVTLSADCGPEDAAKVMGLFDFSKIGQDVWNALSVAIFAMCVRYDALALPDLTQLSTSEETTDPDA